MTKSQGHGSELEQLRELCKQQKAQIKHLKRELKKFSRDSARYKDLQADLEDEEMEDSTTTIVVGNDMCPDCRNGNLVREPLGVRMLVKCGNCRYSRWEKSGKN